MNAKKLMTRAISGAVYIGIIIACALWGIIPFTWMAALFGVLATIEFEKITHEIDRTTLPTLMLDIAGVVCLAFSWMLYPLLVWIFVIICRMTMELYVKNSSPLNHLSRSMMTQLYIGVPLGIMACIGNWWNLHLVLAIFIMIWLNDTGAFLTGSLFGRHRLFERISPKKSWEGFFGGLAFNLLAAYIFCEFFPNFFGLYRDFPLATWLGMGALVTIFATWGDLIESLIKRDLHIKDSGNLIPGHGGILDRIDSLLLVMPATLIYLCLTA